MSENTGSFWQHTPEHWFALLGSRPEGLTLEQVKSLEKHRGIASPSEAVWRRDLRLLLSQFRNPLMLMLLGAVLISAFLGETSDVLIILFMIVSTALLSFFQERNASRTVEKLRALVAIHATVLRAGKEEVIFLEHVLPGDVLVLNAGDVVPADGLILESNALYVNEAALTGEPESVLKRAEPTTEDAPLSKRFNALWEGSHIVSGNAKALVMRTGSETLLGEMKESASVPVESAFEKGITQFGYFLMRVTLVLAVFVLVVNLINGKSLMLSAMFSLALTVGMAPELLPAITTIAMTSGARRLLAQKVIVRKLNAIQNLGEITLLCTDKTGTLTEGNMVVSGLVNPTGESDAWVQQLAYWNASQETGYTNPIDAALKQRVPEHNTPVEPLGELPYDFTRKRLSVQVRVQQENLLISKGSWHSIRSICTEIRMQDGQNEPFEPHAERLEKQYEAYGSKGIRVLGIAYKNTNGNPLQLQDERDLIFAGFILFHDPLKAGAAEAVQDLQVLGVGLKIITGDSLALAKALALQLGIGNPNLLSGIEMQHLAPDVLEQRVLAAHVFAEVEPQQKEHIVSILKKQHAVAYIGDGINDVGALNAADVGISVSNAVDVAREAADFVLTRQDLSVVVSGIQEGRKTFANTLKYMFINTGSTFGNMFSMAAASLMLPFLPMLPKQILMTNFITDFPYLAVSSDEVDSEQVHTPGTWSIKQMRTYMVVFGLHSTLFDLLTFFLLYAVLRSNENGFQTGWFVESTLTELGILFVMRTRRGMLHSRPGKYLFIISLAALALTCWMPYSPLAATFDVSPLPLAANAIIASVVLVYLITADVLKKWFFRRYSTVRVAPR